MLSRGEERRNPFGDPTFGPDFREHGRQGAHARTHDGVGGVDERLFGVPILRWYGRGENGVVRVARQVAGKLMRREREIGGFVEGLDSCTGWKKNDRRHVCELA